ncbi:MAG: sugar ABC transporter permease [Clostridiales bacterium]|jgi:raffinose/stachyose/melibiose transport system permease protein|nr:sugar ABC transporter permease [Clostridiales bacterium]
MLGSSRKLRNAGAFAIFLGPSLLVFICVLLIPLLYGIFLTFTNYSPITETMDFVGLANYAEVFSDKVFLAQFGKTLGYVLYATVFCNITAFVLAYILTSKVKFQSPVRTGFFTPNLIGGIVLGYIWKFIFANVITQIGKAMEYAPLSRSFLTDPDKAIVAMVIVTVWQYAGYLMMIYIAGFVSIPKDVLEAASIDNATGLKKIFNITIPLMIPSFIICFFISISRCFMTYDMNFSLTAGGPYGSSQLASMHIYQKAFQSNRYATGQAEAIVLFIVVAAVAVSQALLAKRFEVEA